MEKTGPITTTGAITAIRDFGASAGHEPCDELPSKRLRVLGEFDVWLGGRSIEIPPVAQRVLAMLALSDASISRSALAGT
jgi:hypothetical protein